MPTDGTYVIYKQTHAQTTQINEYQLVQIKSVGIDILLLVRGGAGGKNTSPGDETHSIP